MANKKTHSELETDVQALKAEMRVYKEKIKNEEKINAKLRRQIDKETKFKNQLIHHNEKYRQILESIQEGYFETNLEGKITFCNKALLDISGYTRKTLIGAIFSDFTPPRTARAMQAVFGKVYKSGKDAKVSNYEVFHKNGHTLIIEFAAALTKDQKGKPVGFRGVFRDVSKQVKAEERERRVRSQLQQAQKMEALGTLAGGLAHGFNNVLMAIQGSLSIIRMNPPNDPDMKKQLARINQSAEKGGRLAREILSFAKVGKYVVMPTDLNKILKSTSKMFLRSNTRLKIHEIYEKRLRQTQVDRVQIGQVLLSLYMNAAEAMPDGGDLYLQSENVYLDEMYLQPFAGAAGWYVKISVTDAGQGLNEEAKRRIFEPFFSPYRPIRYEGMGLAAAYGTIKSHNGFINVYSEEGHGTTFTIYLPVIKKESPGVPVETHSNNVRETVLIVDDDPLTSQIGRDILERQGYRVMMAQNGREAIEIYADYQDQINLVLLDVIMPDLNGDQVFPKLKKRNPNILVLVASGYNVNRQITSMLNNGCVGFVQKPFQSQTLSAKVRMALDKETISPAVANLTS
jgi:two-component system, cell cycle sensor histidine kinase and response regulator CckA